MGSKTKLQTRGLAVACTAAILAVPLDASAFCRTRTVPTAANFDPSKTGQCSTDGVPLFWRNSCVGYSIQNKLSRKVSLDTASDLIATAFTRWSGATCPTDGAGRSRVSIDVRYLGLVECGEIKQVAGAANQNVIVFRDDYWPDKLHGVLGLTTVKYNPTNGEIYGADMEINTHDMDPLVFEDPVKPGGYDFLSIVTHEAGHFLGMGHSDIQHTTMFASYENERGETDLRVLASDDILGICSIYRPDGSRSVLSKEEFQSPQCDPTPRGGYSSVCQEAPGAQCLGSTSPSKPSSGIGWSTAVVGALLLLRFRRRRMGSNRL